VEIFIPLLIQLGIGGIAGFCTGYSLRKIGKLLVVIFGIVFIGLELLAYLGRISINYTVIEEWANGVLSQAEGILNVIIGNLQFMASFLVGLAITFKMG
jgi:uncharacterized membrane protein (Fun14 family)